MSARVKRNISLEDEAAGKFALDVGNESFIPLQEIRCPGCGRFLGFQAIVWGVVKLKCDNSKCKQWVTIDISPEK